MTKTLVQIWEHLKWISERSARWSPESAAQMLTWHHGHESQLSVWTLLPSSWCQQLSGRDSLVEYRNHSVWKRTSVMSVCRGAPPWVVLFLLVHGSESSSESFPHYPRTPLPLHYPSRCLSSGPVAHIAGGGLWRKLPLHCNQDSPVVSLPPQCAGAGVTCSEV